MVTINITVFWFATQCISESPTFLEHITPSSSGSKSKISNTPTEACGLLFYPEDGSYLFLRHVKLSPSYTALHLRRIYSS
jgi:hypothetical protein